MTVLFVAAGSVSAGDRQQSANAPIVFAAEANSLEQAIPPNPDSVTVGVTVGPSNSLTFSPSSVTILIGDTVQWTFLALNHTVSSGAPCILDNMYCTPSDTGCSSAPTMPLNATYSHAFNQAGTYPYFCRVHCNFGMRGIVLVIVPAITTVTRAVDGHFTVTGTSVRGRSATVKSAPDLMTAFANPQMITTDTNGIFQFDDTSTAGATMQFYQVSFP